MFWGVTLENGKRYSQVVDIPVHISMASLDPSTESSSNSSKAVSVMIDHEKSEFVLCTLIPGKIFQQPLDLQFTEGEEVTLFLNGQGIVHLTGYADNSEPGMGEDMDDSEDDLSEFTDEQIEALIRARNRQAEAKGLKRKAIEESPKDSKNKQLKRDAEDEDDDSDEEDDESESDEDDDLDDEDDDDEEDDESEGDSEEEEDSDDEDLYIKNVSKGSGDSQPTPGKGAAAKGLSTPAKQQQNKPNQSPKKTPKAPVLSGQTPKGQPGQTPKGQPGKTSKGQTGQSQKGQPGQTPKGQPGQASKKSPGQQQQLTNSPKTPTVNGNDSLNETESAKRKKRRQKKKKNSLDSTMSDATPAKPGSDSKPAKASEGTPGKGSELQKLPGGVIVEDLKKGNGPVAKAGKFVQVFYTGRLANGKEFDSTKDGKPFKFRLGSNEVIKGWDIGLQGMKVGGTRKITIPASQGYGNKSVGKIPSNSTLVFDVRLAAVN